MADKLTVEELAPFNTYLANYCAAYSSFDMQRVEQLFSDNAVQCIGTGIDEFYYRSGTAVQRIGKRFQ